MYLKDKAYYYTRPIIPSSMPCSLCGSWDANPSWHRCETACVNPQGIAKLHTGIEISCSRSWDDTCWFFFCDRCKKARPHILGVLRNVRIWHSPYIGQTDYTTDTEYSYYSSEGEPCTQEEADEYFSNMETARADALMNRAVECLSTRVIAERLCTNLTAYTEIKLYRACKHIYLGNRARINWWANMNYNIQMACSNNSKNSNNAVSLSSETQ